MRLAVRCDGKPMNPWNFEGTFLVPDGLCKSVGIEEIEVEDESRESIYEDKGCSVGETIWTRGLLLCIEAEISEGNKGSSGKLSFESVENGKICSTNWTSLET